MSGKYFWSKPFTKRGYIILFTVVMFIIISLLHYIFYVYFFWLGFYPYTDFDIEQSNIILSEFSVQPIENMQVIRVINSGHYEVVFTCNLDPEEFVDECVVNEVIDKEKVKSNFKEFWVNDRTLIEFIYYYKDSENMMDNDISFSFCKNEDYYEVTMRKRECKEYRAWQIYSEKQDTFLKKTKMIFNFIK